MSFSHKSSPRRRYLRLPYPYGPAYNRGES